MRPRLSIALQPAPPPDLRDLLNRDPFQPFRVRLTGGDHYDIQNPQLTVMMKSRLFIALPQSDRSVYVPYRHIAALETLENGRRPPARGRARKRGR
ncbi:MAG TPA: hypothetical protein VGM03_14815 [Phycisphaerae bacterium]|jgi:hypothetical protein